MDTEIELYTSFDHKMVGLKFGFTCNSSREPDVRPRTHRKKLRPAPLVLRNFTDKVCLKYQTPKYPGIRPVVLTRPQKSTPCKLVINNTAHENENNCHELLEEPTVNTAEMITEEAFNFLDDIPTLNSKAAPSDHPDEGIHNDVEELEYFSTKRRRSDSMDNAAVCEFSGHQIIADSEFGDKNNNNRNEAEIPKMDITGNDVMYNISYFQLLNNNNEPEGQPAAGMPDVRSPDLHEEWWGEENDSQSNNNNQYLIPQRVGVHQTKYWMSEEERNAIKGKVEFVTELAEHIKSHGHAMTRPSLLTTVRRLFFETLAICGESELDHLTKETFFSENIMLTKHDRSKPIEKTELINVTGEKTPSTKVLHCSACELLL